MWREAVQSWLYRPRPGLLARGAARGVEGVAALRGSRPRPTAPVPTLVVGALSVGGAGKTPVVSYLARRAAARGRRVAIVTRGYGGTEVGPERVDAPDGRRFGDEASALRRALPPGIEVWIGRAEAIRQAAKGVDLIVVDDGFQDPSLPRTLDLVVIDATAPARTLPAGPLREPLSALSRADLVWLHKVDEPGARPLVDAAVESAVAPRALWAPDERAVDLAWLEGRSVALLSGIGRPTSFRRTLEGLGARVERRWERADHHRFSDRELGALLRGGLPVVTTSKDRERLPPGFPAWVLSVDVDVRRGEAGVAHLLESLSC